MFKIEEIIQFLPHRYPFLLVDRILSMEKGKAIVGLKNVTINEPYFQGHFPEKKIMPGVLIVEAMAQCGGILLYHSVENPENKFVLLSRINNVRFRKAVGPGDTLRLEAEIIKIRQRFCELKTKAWVGDEVAAEAEILAAILDSQELHEI
ncbi:MAG: 3-hydroxyacyl-ACP dehydratase FabZ [Candidatus Aminicenantes bacterium]|nr:3-hydroxyacyl-ACP dehydratase FabZ [Candidatus Aminicenantes bacterium]